MGLTATFECEVSLEGLKAEWLKANKPLKANGRISFVADKKIHRLIIKDAKGEDEGEYTIVFKTQNLKSSAKLAVKGSAIICALHTDLIVSVCYSSVCIYPYSVTIFSGFILSI